MTVSAKTRSGAGLQWAGDGAMASDGGEFVETMFTGIVEATGEVAGLTATAVGGVLELELPRSMADGLAVGDSLAVNGCCLTLAGPVVEGRARFDLLGETLRRTNLGDLAAGELVNLERAMRADSRFGGHFVLGHVDDTTRVLELAPEGDNHRLVLALPAAMARYLVPKGSVTVDGMSLTVAQLEQDRLTIWITPHTHRATNLCRRSVGQRVNLEVDILAKHVERLLEARLGDG